MQGWAGGEVGWWVREPEEGPVGQEPEMTVPLQGPHPGQLPSESSGLRLLPLPLTITPQMLTGG